MTRKKRLAFWAIVLLTPVAFFAVFCGTRPTQRAFVRPISHVALRPDAKRDLARDEERGGHTLDRHIGKSDSDLRRRLEEESISADSTYSDRDTAEMAVAAAIRENSDKIGSWLQRPGGHSNLVLDYVCASPLGRSMRRDQEQSFPCSHAVVILKWVRPSDYFVLTSYPDCWRSR